MGFGVREPAQRDLQRAETVKSLQPLKGLEVGHLEAWQRDGRGWRAYVRCTFRVGVQHLTWVGAANVRLSPT